MQKSLKTPIPPGSTLAPLYPTRPMREVMRILRTLDRSRFQTSGDSLNFELELNRLAVVLPTIPSDRALLHWVNRWNVSLKREGEPLPPVSCASFLFERCHFPAACSRTVDFSFMPWTQPSISALNPNTPTLTAVEWTVERICGWGRNTLAQTPLPTVPHQILHENVWIALAQHLCCTDSSLHCAFKFFSKQDRGWVFRLCQEIESHPFIMEKMMVQFDHHVQQETSLELFAA